MTAKTRAALLGLPALAALAGSVVLLALPHHASAAPPAALVVSIGVVFCLSGLVARARRPENRMGLLLDLTGIAAFAVLLTAAESAYVFTLGLALSAVVFAAMVHVLLAYPTGRLGPLEAGLTTTGYLLAFLAPPLSLLFSDDPASCADCPRNVLLLWSSPAAASTVNHVAQAVATALFVAVTVVFVRRWRSATPAYRSTLRGVYAAGMLGLALLGLSFAASAVSEEVGSALVLGAVAAIGLVPIILLAGLLGPRRARKVIGRVVADLGPAPAPGHLRSVLRATLHDPGLEVGYWLSDLPAYVDIEGRPFDPADAPAATYVDGENGRIGVLTHDAALREADVLEGLVPAVRLVLENERLHADLRAKLVEIQQQRSEQSALRRVATVVAAQAPLDELARTVTREVADLFDGQIAAVVRSEPPLVRVVEGWAADGVPAIAAGATSNLAGGDTALGRALVSGVPQRLDEPSWEPYDLSSAIVAPVVVDGQVWGAVGTARLRGSEPFAAGAETRLADVAALVAQALVNAASRAQLSASRARIVGAADEARRKLERNLHDGAQQRLVSVSIALRLSEAKVESDPDAARAALRGASHELSEALSELRELARGIHPAILTDRGLVPALRALADRATLPVEVVAELDAPLPPPVEAAAYYVVSEALANVAKHAHADVAHVRISRRDGLAVVEVEDDGVGGAIPATGSGLRGLADRVEALDGRLTVGPANGRGTRVWAEIPL